MNKQSKHDSRITEMHLTIYDTVTEACYSVSRSVKELNLNSLTPNAAQCVYKIMSKYKENLAIPPFTLFLKLLPSTFCR